MPELATVLENVESSLRDSPAMPRSAEPLDKFVPAKYRASGGMTWEHIKSGVQKTCLELDDWVRVINDFATQLKAKNEEVRRMIG